MVALFVKYYISVVETKNRIRSQSMVSIDI